MLLDWENASDPIFHWALFNPGAPAVIDGRDVLDYRMLAALVAKATSYLRALGIAQGDRIGATLVELSADDDADALAALARKYGLRMVFTEAAVEQPPGVPRICVDVAWRGKLGDYVGDHRHAAGGDALQLLVLTTGSTGAPCGWILSQRDLLRRAAEVRNSRYPERPGAFAPPANVLLILALRYIWSFVSTIVQFAVGGPLVLLPEYEKNADLVRAIAVWDDAIVAVTPNICRQFLAAAPPSGWLFPRLRRLEVAGQPLYGEEKRAVVARITPHFQERYGTTAASCIAALDAPAMATKADSVGRAVPGTDIEIVGAGGQRLPAGVVGLVRSRPPLARGLCAEDRDRSSERIEDGWCYSGDIGFLDAEGYLHLKGRGTDVIRRGGIELHAPAIEAVLLAHPAVADAAVIGLPVQNRSDQIVVAFVLPRGAPAHDEIARHCRARLPAGHLPDHILYPDALPRIPGGKVNRLRLVEIAFEEITRQAAARPPAVAERNRR